MSLEGDKPQPSLGMVQVIAQQVALFTVLLLKRHTIETGPRGVLS